MSFNERISIEGMIKLLEEMLEADPEATKALVNYRVPCNQALADHPSIQVAAYPDGNGPYMVGILGVINGPFGTDGDGWGCIAAVVEEDGRVLRFERIRR